MKTPSMVGCLLVGVAWVGCSSSEREFSEGNAGMGAESSSGAPSEIGGSASQAGSKTAEAGAESGGTQAGGRGTTDEGGAPAGGSEAEGGSPPSSGAAGSGDAGNGSGPVQCSEEQTYCSGTDSCSDLAADAKNCGRCGHDCGALADCENSRCKPAPLVTGLPYARGFDVSAKGLFYTTNNTIVHCTSPTKCPSTMQQVGSPSSASTLAVTKTLATDVVAFFGRVAASDKYAGYITCPASGCGASTLASPGPSGAVTGLLGDGGDLFYQSSGTTDLSTSSLVRLSGKADGTPGAKLSLGDRAQVSGRIAVDSSYVYYVRVDASNAANVVACSRTTGCGDTYVSLGTGVPTNFAAYGGKLYWHNGIQLKRCDATDPSTTEPITALPGAYDGDMLVDADNIYWLTGNSLLYCELPSCTGGIKTLASGLASPTALRLHDGFLYWLVPSASGVATGGIYRIAKP